MKILRAVELRDVLNENFQSIGRLRLFDYIDPSTRYEQHLDVISGYENVSDHMVEQLIRSYGADNFPELSKTPDQMLEEIERITSCVDDNRRVLILEEARSVSEKMKDSIQTHQKDRMPIDKTRKSFGITSEIRKDIEKSNSPIDEIWRLISPSVPRVTKNQFFGFEPIPRIEGVQHIQHGAISGAHTILNMLGISPDKGLAKREKIKNIISDGQHAGMASYCNALISADKAFINKARCIYTYLNNITNALHFEYQRGRVINLEVKRA